MENLVKCICGGNPKIVHDGNGEWYHVECSWCTNITETLWKAQAITEWNKTNANN